MRFKLMNFCGWKARWSDDFNLGPSVRLSAAPQGRKHLAWGVTVALCPHFLQPRRWLCPIAQGCEALRATLGSEDNFRSTPKVLRPYPNACKAGLNGRNPVGVEAPSSGYPELLADSRTLGWKTEHLWCSRRNSGVGLTTDLEPTRQRLKASLQLRTPAKIMLPLSIVPKGRRQLAPGFNLGTELEKRIEAPKGRRSRRPFGAGVGFVISPLVKTRGYSPGSLRDS